MIEREKVDLFGLSDISVEYEIMRRVKPYREILVCKFSGIYKSGCEGYEDAQFIGSMINAGLAAWEDTIGLIVDFSDLDYIWGDNLVFGYNHVYRTYLENKNLSLEERGCNFRYAIQSALIVGPKCQEAIRTLILGENSEEPIDTIPWIFHDIESAFKFIEKQINVENKE